MLPVANIGPAVWSIPVEAGTDSLSIEVVAVGVLLWEVTVDCPAVWSSSGKAVKGESDVNPDFIAFAASTKGDFDV